MTDDQLREEWAKWHLRQRVGISFPVIPQKQRTPRAVYEAYYVPWCESLGVQPADFPDWQNYAGRYTGWSVPS